jgi:arsenite methyltransferase
MSDAMPETMPNAIPQTTPNAMPDASGDDIRSDVKDFYAGALRDADAAGTSCCGAPPSASVLAPDYAPDALAALPADAVVNSFGCGNPVAFAAVEPGQTVLDLGCGAGIDLLLAAERVGPGGRVIGVDMGEAMLERARANIERAGVANVELHQATIEALPLADASVDHVVSNCVINLSPDKPAVFAEIHRVLRPGGRMLVSDIVVDDLPDWILASRDLYAACVSGAVTEAEYLAHVAGAGLADARVVDRFEYDAASLLGMADMVPVDLDALAARLGTDREALLAMLAQQLAGKVRSIKVSATRAH